jgi:hypothetical protein
VSRSSKRKSQLQSSSRRRKKQIVWVERGVSDF